MPELPEVETVVSILKQSLLNQTVLSLDLRYKPLVEANSLDIHSLIGKTFQVFKRRGKYLLFGLDNLWFIVHLRMEGKFILYPKDNVLLPSKHTHLVITTHDFVIHYQDTRKFSRFIITDNLDDALASKHLGLEPFDSLLTVSYLMERFQKRSLNIKTVLLDQSIIAGLGNIYADEVLFAAGIHPMQSARSLTHDQCQAIIEHTRKVLTEAIRQGGTTIRSYTAALNVTGRFQVALNVYGRKNQPCRHCQTILTGQKLGGRSTVWCPQCQALEVHHKIAITGLIGSGKSEVGSILRDLGYPVWDADRLAHDLYRPDTDLYHWLVSQYGSSILKEDLTINRKQLAAYVFTDEAKISDLEARVFPEIRKSMDTLFASQKGLVFFEVSMLFEGKMVQDFDEVWFVDAKSSLRHKRLALKGYTQEEIKSREKRQISAAIKRKQSTRVLVNNSDKAMLKEAVFKAIERSLR